MEQLHGVFATFLHNQYLKELLEVNPTFDLYKHTEDCHAVIRSIIAHEDAVINYVYEQDDSINDITADELKAFIRSRANLVLTDMGFIPEYEVGKNPIAEWFYQGINSIKVHDFFAANTTQYRRNWKFDNFSYFQGGTDE